LEGSTKIKKCALCGEMFACNDNREAHFDLYHPADLVSKYFYCFSTNVLQQDKMVDMLVLKRSNAHAQDPDIEPKQIVCVYIYYNRYQNIYLLTWFLVFNKSRVQVFGCFQDQIQAREGGHCYNN
jgi:hypothetical protein